LAEELPVAGAELGADVLQLASRHSRLQDRGYRPGVTGGLVFTDAFFLRHPLIESLHGEGLSSSVSLNVGGNLRRKPGGEVRGLLPG
jgi:hypothetical protein